MDVASLIKADIIRTPLRAQTRITAIRELVEVLGESGAVSDVDAAVELVWAREQERTTGIGEGLAVPHARVPGLKGLQVAIGRAATPIDFNAFDQKPVRLIVLVLSPPDRTADHIQVLGWLSRRLADRVTRLSVYDAQTPEAMADMLRGVCCEAE
ncbi:MAG: PTS sugar transporter subunit IIA [Phycisphaerales bacterium]|nr:PTS sugar transporter subunit IIA [Phycisphaerales bacterium]